MTDVLTAEQRRKNMQHIRAKDTDIEIQLRKALRSEEHTSDSSHSRKSRMPSSA